MEEKAAYIALGKTPPGYRFTIRYGWFKFRLGIKLISTERLIRMSGHLCKIRDLNFKEETTTFQALMSNVSDARHTAKVIAIATGTPFVRLVSRAILKLPNKDHALLFKMVMANSDPDSFFFTMTSAKRMNLMKKKPEQ